MKEPVKRRRYSAEERAAALADVKVLGVSGAARKHGMPVTSLGNWIYRAGAASADRSPAGASAATAEGGAEAKPVSGASVPAGADVATAKGGAETESVSGVTAVGRATGKGKRVARRYTPSEKAEILEYAAANGPAATHRQFGVSRFSIRDWQRKVAAAAAGMGPSPTSGPAPADIEARRDEEILAMWREHPGLGPSQVRNQLKRAGKKVSVHTVRRVMEDAGYRPPKVRSHPHDKRFEAVRPNHLWHLDFLHRHINRATTFSLILIDDFSRFVVGHGVDDAERAALVTRTFTEAVERHGRPERVIHDKGSAFWSWRGISQFTTLLTELGIDQVVAEHKEWNGKLEVFNANLSKELFDVHRFYDLAEMRRRLASHLHWYNHRRTHHALGGLLVPADRFYGRVDEVMARIEAGAGASAHTDLLDLRDRVLELFRVTSRDGKPEVWLMGHRLLPLPTA